MLGKSTAPAGKSEHCGKDTAKEFFQFDDDSCSISRTLLTMPEVLALSSSNDIRPVMPPLAEIPTRAAGPPHAKPRTFLFIDAKSDLPQNQGQKKAYLLKKYHRRRQQVAIERLKPSKDSFISRHGLKCLATGHSKNDRSECDDPTCTCKKEEASRLLNTRSKVLPVTNLLGQSYIDPFGVTGVEMSDSMNLYFHHCRPTRSLCLV